MDHKKFMLELQKRTGLDKSRLVSLLKTTQEVIYEQQINLNSIYLDGIGEIVPKKRLEFIYKNPRNQEVVLYPPRITVHFKPQISK
ncbi:MAG: HU family DNA-binding protein [Bacteroidales bacterium]|nr:HU family DNA-binding protein [Bacteroidales bacterium]